MSVELHIKFKVVMVFKVEHGIIKVSKIVRNLTVYWENVRQLIHL